jgi:acylphosphatase
MTSESTAPGAERSSEGTAIHVLVSGQVQGIGYRVFVQRAAEADGSAGWVRNLRDGRVEAVLAGPAAAVQATLDAIARGPCGARVDDVVTRPALDAERILARRPLAIRSTS